MGRVLRLHPESATMEKKGDSHSFSFWERFYITNLHVSSCLGYPKYSGNCSLVFLDCTTSHCKGDLHVRLVSRNVLTHRKPARQYNCSMRTLFLDSHLLFVQGCLKQTSKKKQEKNSRELSHLLPAEVVQSRNSLAPWWAIYVNQAYEPHVMNINLSSSHPIVPPRWPIACIPQTQDVDGDALIVAWTQYLITVRFLLCTLQSRSLYQYLLCLSVTIFQAKKTSPFRRLDKYFIKPLP